MVTGNGNGIDDLITLSIDENQSTATNTGEVLPDDNSDYYDGGAGHSPLSPLIGTSSVMVLLMVTSMN